MWGVIVLTRSVCVFVLLSQVNRQTYRLEFRHVGQVDDYLGQFRRARSKVKVTRSNKNVSNGDYNELSMGYLSEERDGLVDGPAKEASKEYNCEAYDAGCTQNVCGFIPLNFLLHAGGKQITKGSITFCGHGGRFFKQKLEKFLGED